MLVVKKEVELIYVRCHQQGYDNKLRGFYLRDGKQVDAVTLETCFNDSFYENNIRVCKELVKRNGLNWKEVYAIRSIDLKCEYIFLPILQERPSELKLVKDAVASALITGTRLATKELEQMKTEGISGDGQYARKRGELEFDRNTLLFMRNHFCNREW